MQQFCVPCGFSFHKIGRPTVVPSSSVILDLGCWYPPPLSLANLWVALFTLGFSALLTRVYPKPCTKFSLF